jgi:Zn-dependent peptidase ImmA (M78 family)
MDAARRARASLGLSPEEPVRDLLGAIDARRRLPVVVMPMRATTAGAYVAAPGRAVVLVNSDQWPTRARFTLAHELGHHHLRHDSVRDDVGALTRVSKDPQEVEANAYAAELLVPEAGVRAWWERHGGHRPTLEDVVRLAVHFGVSAEVARYRMWEARCLYSATVAARLDEEIRRGEHRWLVNVFGLTEPEDTLSQAVRDPPHVPPMLRGSALAQRLGVAS